MLSLPARVFVTPVVVAIIVPLLACGSPETPPPGTSPAPAANPAPPAAAAPAAARPRVIEGYPELPVSAELSSNLGDLARDIVNVANKHPNAADEFADDLHAMTIDENPRARPPIDRLAQELASTLPNAKGTDTLASRLSDLLFVAARPGNLPEARFEQLESDVQKLLTDHGVPAAQAKTASGHVRALAVAAKQPA